MTFLPVVAREMGVLARRKSMYWSRWVTAVLALLVMLWLLAVSSSQVSFAQLGRSIFTILSSLCFTFAVLVGMQATSDSVSEEKREGTLGLLFLTDLNGIDVIAGKLAVSSMHAVLVLIGVIPMMSLSLLLGGVTLSEFGLSALVLLNTMFLSLSLGVCVSCFSKNERKAMVGTFVGLFVIVLGPFIVGILLRSYLGFSEELLAISPLYAFGSLHAIPVRMMIGPAGPSFFWYSLAFTFVLAWCFLGVAAWVLPKFVNDLPALRFERVRNFVDNFVYGRIEQRKRHRAELLDRNAFLWLASRERVKTKYAWGIIAFFLGLYLWIALQFENMLFDLAVGAALMMLIHLVFKIWLASEVCSRLIEDRRSGALELLLSTPLSVREIAHGQSAALGRIFLKPIIFLLAMEALFILGGMNEYRQQASKQERLLVFGTLIGTFLLDLWALKWVGLWLSMSAKSMERVLITTIVRVLLLPWLIFAVLSGLRMLNSGQGDSVGAVVNWMTISVLVSLFMGASSRNKFLTQFRELATKRFESMAETEPEVKKIKKAPVGSGRRRWILPEVFRRRPVASWCFTALFLVVIVAWGRGQFWRYRLESEIAAVRAARYPTTMSEAARYYAPIPPAQNAFAVLSQGGMLRPNWRGGPLLNRRVIINGKPATAEELKHMETGQAMTVVASNPGVLSAMWELPKFQNAYFNITGSDPTNPNGNWDLQFNHMGYATVLEADLITRARQSLPIESGKVMQSIRALLAHARLLRKQPLTFAQFCAGESLRRLSSGLDDVLEQDMLTEAMLIELEAELHKMQIEPTIAHRTLALQRAYFLEPIPIMPGVAFGMMMPPPRPAPFAFIEQIRGAMGSSERVMAQALADYRRSLEFAGSPYHAISSKLGAIAGRNGEFQRFQAVRTGGMQAHMGSINEVFWADAAFNTQLRLIRAAVAAERFELKHKRLPSSLAEIASGSDLPVAVFEDTYSGKPLGASIVAEGLRIYSVGMDQRVDGSSFSGGQKQGDDIEFLFK